MPPLPPFSDGPVIIQGLRSLLTLDSCAGMEKCHFTAIPAHSAVYRCQLTSFFSQTCLGIEKSLLTASTRTRGPNHYFDIPHWKYLYPDYDHVQYLTVQIKVQRFDLTCDVIRNLLRLC